MKVRRGFIALELGRRARVSSARIWKFENGYAEPRPDERERLAKTLRVSVEDVFPVSQQVAS